MDKDIENWFHKEFMPEVHSFMKEKLFPEKAVLLLKSGPFYPKTLSSGGDLMIVKFLSPSVSAVIQHMDQGVIVSVNGNFV
jgi:hypothetical protein